MFSRSSSTSIRGSRSIQQRPSASHRASVSSRISLAISTAEQGEGGNESHDAPAQQQIEEEIAEIKRYEVCRIVIICSPGKILSDQLMIIGLHNYRYELPNATR